MASEELPEEVLRFIADHIDSVPQLEALLLMWDTAPQAWTAEQMSKRIYVPAGIAGDILVDLQRRKLAIAAEDGRTRFNPETPEAAAVPTLAGVYRRQLARVAGLIHSKASVGVLEFARAFRIKKE
jgi:hypothetical protein